MQQEIEKKLFVSKQFFPFVDNCIWIGCGKFCLYQREYLSSAVNVLTNSPQILHITKKDIFRLEFFYSDEKYDKSAAVHISAVFRTL